MLLPSYKRINQNDYSAQYKDLVSRLSVGVNSGFDSLYQMAGNNISLGNNVYCDIVSVTVMVDSTGAPTAPLLISTSNVTSSPIGTQVLLAQNQTNSMVYPTGQPFISYTLNGNNLSVNNITGLPANNKFTLTVVIYG